MTLSDKVGLYIYSYRIAPSKVTECRCHRDESGLYAANTGIEHTRKYSLCSQSEHVDKQRPKYKECFNKENITDVYYYK